jgi:endonuclease YncB( thermonuclease family)
MFHYRASLVRVIDGDSLVIDVDAGFYVTIRQHVRLAGIDTPELNARDPTARLLAQQARARLMELLPAEFTVRTYKTRLADKYGRFLADIELPDGRLVSDVLLSEGLGKPYAGGARV